MSQWRPNLWLLMCSTLWILGCNQPTVAQVIPDNTLPGGERSQVSGNSNFQIDGGAKRGGNLFHSFQSFSIPTGGSAYFNNGADVQNIFSRVTSGSISNVDGVIKANGTANLFLLNPNGIVFGAGASLNIGGSFVGTTANAIAFPNREVFSSDVTQPLPSQLLTINPNALLFNQLTPQPIINRSNSNMGLQVPSKQNLLLIGGPIQFDGGQSGGRAISSGNYVELAAVGGLGTVGLSTKSDDWQLTIPDGVTRADVSLTNGSGIYVQGASGSIRILAHNIDISGGELRIEIPSDSRLPDSKTGDLDLNATGSITISDFGSLDNWLFGQGTMGSINLTAGDRVSLDGSEVQNILEDSGVGNVGNINITTGSLSLTGGTVLYSETRGQGNVGSVNINARDRISLVSSAVVNDVFNPLEPTNIGKVGDINITTGSLSLSKAQLFASMWGQGSTGNVNINARDTVSLDDSGVYNSLAESSIGQVGDINITTGSLSLSNGAYLYSNTYGQGNAGNVNINARDRVSLDGQESYSFFITSSSIFSQVGQGSVGKGGDVTIATDSLFLTNGGAVNTSNEGGIGNAGRVTIQARDVQINGTSPTRINSRGERTNYYRSGVFTSTIAGSVGSGGDVSINTHSLSVSNQGRIDTNAQGQGKAGNIQIQAEDTVSFDGGDAISTLSPSGVGTGGDIDITARSLSLLNGSQLAASTAGSGNAGNITVNADAVGLSSGGQLLTTTFSSGRAGDITINSPDLQLSGATSGLFADTTSAADAGNLTIQPRGNGQSVRVNLQDGAQISASTKASGQGGKLTITAPESITLTGDGSIIAAGTAGSGQGGDLNLQTGTLSIQNQAQVTVSSLGTGSAGLLFVDADRIYLNNQGSIRADTTGGGGNIFLRTPLLLLRNGSSITTNATGENIPGGDISIDAKNGFIIAVPQENSDISANSLDFRGGNVNINAQAIYGTQFRTFPTSASDITATGVNPQLNGSVQINTPDVNPSSGLVELPANFVDRSGLIAQGCPASKGNTFTITGRGGLPPLPTQALRTNQTATVNWVTLNPQEQKTTTVGENLHLSLGRKNRKLEVPQISPTIVEATGWIINKSGKVQLTVSTPVANHTNTFTSAIASGGASLRDATRTLIAACPNS
ncbi:filamentous hemagglutinin N-terminal domain-containing protein [Nostoc sp. PA-18-2419]|uniref:two-partner secretion domain-containing protein n=1 Tax=Nostoc sp. PA-18-2419 TaxID=2575443 RepID=UPI001107FA5D|nr:filamentous hemagglutinin N-terminal domain-containing protein [Nostoc sp. PA-18-2419]